MKRVVFLLVVCITLLLATGVTSSLASQHASATTNVSIQMFSGTFPDTQLSTSYSQNTTLVSFPFTVSVSKSKLEVTSLMTANSNGIEAIITCELDLDSVSFFSVDTLIDPYHPAPTTSVGLTHTITGILSGKHTLVLVCHAGGSPGPIIHSLGTSMIVTS